MPDLPSEPSLQQLRHQARDLQRAVRRGDQDALAEVAGRHPAGARPAPDGAAVAAFPLSAAQLVVARRYDFPSWARLRRYVEVVERYSRFPERMTAGGNRKTRPTSSSASPACTTRMTSQNAGRRRAGSCWTTQRSPGSACARPRPRPTCRGWSRTWPPTAGSGQAGRPVPLRAAVLPGLRPPRPRHRRGRGARRRPDAAPGRRGPERRLPVARPADSVHRADRRLRRGRARPGAPATPPALAGPGPPAARSGADPNDGQALYNRMFEPGRDHLELLFEFGLGAGDGGPWKARMGDALDTPEQMVRGQLRWALTHGMTERVRLLVEHGVDVASPFERRRSRLRSAPPLPGTPSSPATWSSTAPQRPTSTPGSASWPPP